METRRDDDGQGSSWHGESSFRYPSEVICDEDKGDFTIRAVIVSEVKISVRDFHDD